MTDKKMDDKSIGNPSLVLTLVGGVSLCVALWMIQPQAPWYFIVIESILMEVWFGVLFQANLWRMAKQIAESKNEKA